jgi:hypothetical protein
VKLIENQLRTMSSKHVRETDFVSDWVQESQGVGATLSRRNPKIKQQFEARKKVLDAELAKLKDLQAKTRAPSVAAGWLPFALSFALPLWPPPCAGPIVPGGWCAGRMYPAVTVAAGPCMHDSLATWYRGAPVFGQSLSDEIGACHQSLLSMSLLFQ